MSQRSWRFGDYDAVRLRQFAAQHGGAASLFSEVAE
jgi:hypothetical protein